MKGKRQEEEGFNAETAEAQRTQRRKEKGTGKGQSGTLPAGRYGGGDTPGVFLTAVAGACLARRVPAMVGCGQFTQGVPAGPIRDAEAQLCRLNC